MNEIDYLKAELKDDTLDWTPNKHLLWMLAMSLERLVPESLIVGRMSVRTKKAARLLFARYITGRPIVSFKQLKPGEIVRIKRWIEGNGPSPNDDKAEEDKEAAEWLRADELKQFWVTHSKEIMNLAHWLKASGR